MEQRRERVNHWIRHNHQNRIPSRWVAFDSEAKKSESATGEVQTWRLGCAVRWRSDLKGGDAAEWESFNTPEDIWKWVTDFCRPKTRTVVWACNLGYDIRITAAMDILPKLGWHLDWCNLGAQVSTMTWRSDRGTLTFADLTSWLPMGLDKVGELVGIPKMKMPGWRARKAEWVKYCMNDVRILYTAASELIAFVRSEDLGNWQPTGAGMAFATWRHKFLEHSILVHNDEKALKAERSAMHTGRAEAWRHGRLIGDQWTEVDLRQAYVHIARDCELPTKLKWHEDALTLGQYRALRRWACVLVRAEIRTELPCVPVYHHGRTLWPVGHFTTWLWDCELDAALESGCDATIREAYVYTRAPVLSKWADWIFTVQKRAPENASPVVQRYVKHSGRTLIGRIALRTAQWAVWGTNPDSETGISYLVDSETGKVNRLMHVGDRTMVEEARIEGQDSLPQITGYITAVARVRLWQAMAIAGFDNIAHVDTDSVLVNAEGLERLRREYAADFDGTWQIKATYHHLTVYGPRNYRADGIRKTAGIPRGAKETGANKFDGVTWSSMSKDMARGDTSSVTISKRSWEVAKKDPRRRTAPGGRTRTVPYVLDQSSKSLDDSGASGRAGS